MCLHHIRLQPTCSTLRRRAESEGQSPDEAAFPGMSLHAEELPPGASLNIKKRDALLGDVRVRCRPGEHQE